MDVINFFYITSGRINTWKGVNQFKELFFLNLIIYSKNTFEIDKSYVFYYQKPVIFHNS